MVDVVVKRDLGFLLCGSSTKIFEDVLNRINLYYIICTCTFLLIETQQTTNTNSVNDVTITFSQIFVLSYSCVPFQYNFKEWSLYLYTIFLEIAAVIALVFVFRTFTKLRYGLVQFFIALCCTMLYDVVRRLF